MLQVPLLDPSTPPPSPTPSCARSSELCHFIFERTQRVWLAESSYWMLEKPLRIVLIIILAIVARFVVHRAISRVIRRTAEPGQGSLLAPLRERISPALRAAVVLPSERRRQRAEALGSILRSVASTTLVVIAIMLVLAEIGVNLGPLLASAGIAGVAIGFGAQNLVKDFLAGIFILFEDQYGVGDTVDLSQPFGTVSGTVEEVGLRITTIRDDLGALWYIRNGEIVRVGNRSQGWSRVVVDVQVKFAFVARASEVHRAATEAMAADPEWADHLITPPKVLGIEEITPDATVLRITAKTNPDTRLRLGRELRRRITDALHEAGLDAEATPAEVTTTEIVPVEVAQPGSAQTGSAQPGGAQTGSVQPGGAQPGGVQAGPRQDQAGQPSTGVPPTDRGTKAAPPPRA